MSQDPARIRRLCLTLGKHSVTKLRRLARQAGVANPDRMSKRELCQHLAGADVQVRVDQPPEYLLDFYNQVLLTDSYITEDNRSYDRGSIAQFQAQGNGYRSPVTRETLVPRSFRPNMQMREAAAQWRMEHGSEYPAPQPTDRFTRANVQLGMDVPDDDGFDPDEDSPVAVQEIAVQESNAPLVFPPTHTNYPNWGVFVQINRAYERQYEQYFQSHASSTVGDYFVYVLQGLLQHRLDEVQLVSSVQNCLVFLAFMLLSRHVASSTTLKYRDNVLMLDVYRAVTSTPDGLLTSVDQLWADFTTRAGSFVNPLAHTLPEAMADDIRQTVQVYANYVPDDMLRRPDDLSGVLTQLDVVYRQEANGADLKTFCIQFTQQHLFLWREVVAFYMSMHAAQARVPIDSRTHTGLSCRYALLREAPAFIAEASRNLVRQYFVANARLFPQLAEQTLDAAVAALLEKVRSICA